MIGLPTALRQISHEELTKEEERQHDAIAHELPNQCGGHPVQVNADPQAKKSARNTRDVQDEPVLEINDRDQRQDTTSGRLPTGLPIGAGAPATGTANAAGMASCTMNVRGAAAKLHMLRHGDTASSPSTEWPSRSAGTEG